MKKTFRPWDVSQGNLFPPAPRELVPTDHLSHFIRDLVCDELDLSAIYAHYDEFRGPRARLSRGGRSLIGQPRYRHRVTRPSGGRHAPHARS
ncbi:MAG: hypothetical protein MUE73_20470 [Planctomycetes bacterium]|nr:hypothetical protein [Planctomycetota bacterium]